MDVALLIFGLAAIGFAGLWWNQRRECSRLTKRLDTARESQARAEAEYRQALAEAKAQREVLVRSMGEAVLVLDGEDRVEMFNPAFERLFAARPELHGRRVLEAFRSHELDELVRQTRASGQVFGAELEWRGSQPRSFQVNAAEITGGGIQGMILVFHDMTRIRELESTRKEFVANVSHELRTPLSLIKGYVETLLDGAKDDPAVALRFLHTIARHTDRLTYLIEDLLTISRLESGAAVHNPQPVPLFELASRTVEDLASRASERRMELRNEIPPQLTARVDSDRVQQVFFNLIDNALKYGRPETPITLGARQLSPGFLEAWVRDEGPGIPLDAQARVFERFFRVDKNRSREQGGTGLGLAIVKHIIQSHGGEVRVQSEPGRGATFYFTVPREPRGAMPEAATP